MGCQGLRATAGRRDATFVEESGGNFSALSGRANPDTICLTAVPVFAPSSEDGSSVCLARAASIPSDHPIHKSGDLMHSARTRLAFVIVAILTAGAARASERDFQQVASLRPDATMERPTFAQEGVATWYGKGRTARRTASGERFDVHAMTAAHRTLPFGTIVRVTNLESGQSIRVRINDRGPNVRPKTRRILDLSRGAAAALGMTKGGIAKVRIEALTSDQRVAALNGG